MSETEPQLEPNADAAPSAELPITSIRDRELLGLPREGLTPFEIAVIKWLREELVRVSSPYESCNVGVLMVGSPVHVPIVDHQLDHIGGGGLASVMHGKQIVSGKYHAEGMEPNEETAREWVIYANMLADQCESVSQEEEAKANVTLPDRGELGEWMDFSAGEHLRGGLQNLELAQQWAAAFPGEPLKLVSAFAEKVTFVNTPAEAEAFYAENGELTMPQVITIDDAEYLDIDALKLVAQASELWKADPKIVLKAALQRFIETAQEAAALAPPPPPEDGTGAPYPEGAE